MFNLASILQTPASYLSYQTRKSLHVFPCNSRAPPTPLNLTSCTARSFTSAIVIKKKITFFHISSQLWKCPGGYIYYTIQIIMRQETCMNEHNSIFVVQHLFGNFTPLSPISLQNIECVA